MGMIDVKRTLRRGGVAALVKECGGGAPDVLWGQRYGANLRKAWGEVENPRLTLDLMLAIGVEEDSILQGVQLAFRRLETETGERLPALASTAMQAAEGAAAEPDGDKTWGKLYSSLRDCTTWLREAGHLDDGNELDNWDGLVVASATSIAQATWAVICTCGMRHPVELQRSLEGALFTLTMARVVHGRKSGRLPAGTSETAAITWAAGLTAASVRELVPVELLMAPNMVTIPGVTQDGRLVWNQRKRGQA